MSVVYQYVGQGEYFEAIPARDLDEDDMAALTDEQRALVKKSDLYQVPPKPEPKPQAPSQPVEQPKKEGDA